MSKIDRIFSNQCYVTRVSNLRVCLDGVIRNSREIKIQDNPSASIEFLSFLIFVVWIKDCSFKIIYFYKFQKIWGKMKIIFGPKMKFCKN